MESSRVDQRSCMGKRLLQQGKYLLCSCRWWVNKKIDLAQVEFPLGHHALLTSSWLLCLSCHAYQGIWEDGLAFPCTKQLVRHYARTKFYFIWITIFMLIWHGMTHSISAYLYVSYFHTFGLFHLSLTKEHPYAILLDQFPVKFIQMSVHPWASLVWL